MPRNGEHTGVEIKISFDQQVTRALDELGLDGHGEPRRIGFLEDTTVGVALPLFHQGIVLRVRQNDDDADDTTVKLRPCRQSQLAGNWLGAEEGDGWKLTVEQDWAGSRRALEGSEPTHRLFSQGQARFLADCAGTPINLDALTLLPTDNRNPVEEGSRGERAGRRRRALDHR
jgi:hypothetical protein